MCYTELRLDETGGSLHRDFTCPDYLKNAVLPCEEFLRGQMEGVEMNREFSVVIEKDEDGYFVASVPTLRGCHTQAKSLDVLMKRIKEAIELCLEVEEPVATEFIGIQRVAVNT